MTLSWSYPLYLIRIGAGFASVVEDDEEKSICSVVVFTSRERMERFLEKAQLAGESRELTGDREFAAFAQSLKPPITHVVFDSDPQGKQVNPRWSIEIPALLRDHLPLSASPWGYPVYVIRERDGYSCIDGTSDAQGTVQALSLFTKFTGAREYRTNAKIKGDIRTLQTPADLRELLMELRDSVAAVALDPTVDGESRKAKVCVALATVIERYLANAGNE